MRDIRDDLKERLSLCSSRRDTAKAAYEREIKAVAEEETRLKAILAEEDRRFGEPERAPEPQILPLADFLVKAAASFPRTKDQFRQLAEAEGYFSSGEESPGRTIHATVVNLVRSGRLLSLLDGTFQATMSGGASSPQIGADIRERLLDYERS